MDKQHIKLWSTLLFWRRILWSQICLSKYLLESTKKFLKNGLSWRYDWFSLIISDICNNYSVSVRNKFNTLQEISEKHDLYDELEKCITAHLKAAVECRPIKESSKSRIIWDSKEEKGKNEVACKKHLYVIKGTKKKKKDNTNMKKHVTPQGTIIPNPTMRIYPKPS